MACIISQRGSLGRSFFRQRLGDKPPRGLFSAGLRFRLIGDPDFEGAEFDRVERYDDRSRAQAWQVTTPDLRGGRTGGAHEPLESLARHDFPLALNRHSFARKRASLLLQPFTQ
jgi:hypothetical protein